MEAGEHESFPEIKRRFKTAVQSILDHHASAEIDEAALPAYAHNNPIIDDIFWRRVKIAYDHAIANGATRVLDFGCGTGLLSYALAAAGKDVVAIDLNLGPLQLVRDQVAFPDSITFIEGDLLTQDLGGRHFDLIVALDVLEHISDLRPYISKFSSLLTPNGAIVISGPSENWLYKAGRRLAGSRFTGDYHVSDIGTIREEFAKSMDTHTLANLVWPLTLFEIFVARKRSAVR
jgi:2-polyprenyl-3-methyl-5-hydroxy-6-metoxy-1,4-benzoquinol methylase